MANLPEANTSSRRHNATVGAAISIVVGFVLIMYGIWGPGTGLSGVIKHAVLGGGILVFGLGIGAIGLMLGIDARRERADMSLEDRQAERKLIVRQAVAAVLNVVIYGGAFILLMGSISALDGASAGTIFVVVVAWIVTALVIVMYRRWRKSHPISYKEIRDRALLTLFAVITVVCSIMGVVMMVDSVRDITTGPRTVLCNIVDIDIDYPRGRYRAFQQDTYELDFITNNNEVFHLSVPTSDRPSLDDLVAAGGSGYVTYYPICGVYVSCVSYK